MAPLPGLLATMIPISPALQGLADGNLIDVFLVIIAALPITVAQNPLLNPFNQRDVTVITDPGKSDMEIVVKKGEKIERHQVSGAIGSGDGEKAGAAFRVKDGAIVYVPKGGTP